MKKDILYITLAVIFSVFGSSANASTLFAVSDSQIADNDAESSSDVDRLVHLLDDMTNKLAANPDKSNEIISGFETLGLNLNEDTPLTASDITKLNTAMDNFFNKMIIAALKMEGVNYDDLDTGTQSQIQGILNQVSTMVKDSTVNVRTLGEYMEVVGHVMDGM